MNTRISIALGVVIGFGLGAVSIYTLHAQAQGKPPVYLISEIDVTNPDAYGKEFAPKAQATVRASGARFIVIGGAAGAGAKPVTALAGTPPKRVTIQAWESIEALNKVYASKGLKIVAVSIDDPGTDATIRAFVKQYGLTFEVLHDPKKRKLYDEFGEDGRVANAVPLMAAPALVGTCVAFGIAQLASTPSISSRRS